MGLAFLSIPDLTIRIPQGLFVFRFRDERELTNRNVY